MHCASCNGPHALGRSSNICGKLAFATVCRRTHKMLINYMKEKHCCDVRWCQKCFLSIFNIAYLLINIVTQCYKRIYFNKHCNTLFLKEEKENNLEQYDEKKMLCMFNLIWPNYYLMNLVCEQRICARLPRATLTFKMALRSVILNLRMLYIIHFSAILLL